MDNEAKEEFRRRLEAKYLHYKPLIGDYMKELVDIAVEVAESMEGWEK